MGCPFWRKNSPSEKSLIITLKRKTSEEPKRAPSFPRKKKNRFSGIKKSKSLEGKGSELRRKRCCRARKVVLHSGKLERGRGPLGQRKKKKGRPCTTNKRDHTHEKSGSFGPDSKRSGGEKKEKRIKRRLPP